MNKDKYPWYVLAVLAGGGFAVWAGLPPVLLLFLLVCPLMMFAMHGGGHRAGRGREQVGGAEAQDEHGHVSGNVKHK